MSNNPQRDEIIRRMDLLAEFQKYGGRVPPNAQVSPDGWIPVHSIDREDEHPSAALNIGNDPSKGGVYVDHAPTGKGGHVYLRRAHPAAEFPLDDGERVLQALRRGYGVDNGDGKPKAEKIAPTMGDVEGFQKNFSPETKDFLRDKRGLTEDSLSKYRVGWCLKRQRNAFPVFDENGNLVNIRFHNSKKEPKTLNWAGYGSARLWGLDRLAKAAPGITVLLTEGEFDAMLAEQETGFLAVSGTNGAKSFQDNWVKSFHGFHVVVLYDGCSRPKII